MSITIGLSGNLEIIVTGETDKEKGLLESCFFKLGGSAINIYRTLACFGASQNTHIVILTGDEKLLDPNGKIVQGIFDKILEQEPMMVQKIPCMDKPNLAIIDVFRDTLSGQKGTIAPNFTHSSLAKIGSAPGLTIATGVRTSELELARQFLGNQKGYRSLNLKPEVLQDEQLLKSILPFTDFLFMNDSEHKKSVLKFPELHAMGVNFIAVTMNNSGVVWSLANNPDQQFYVEGIKVSEPTYSTGCGDCFHAAFFGALFFYRKNLDLSKLVVSQAIAVANHVAAEKAKLPGGSNVPSAEIVRKILEMYRN